MKLFALAALTLFALSAQAQTSVVGMASEIGTATVPGTAPVVFPSAKQPRVVCTGTATCTFAFGSAITPGSNVGAYIVSNGSTSTCTMMGEIVTRIANASNNAGFQADFWLISKAVGGQTALVCTTGASSSDLGVAFEVTNLTANAAPLDASGNAHNTTTALTVSTTGATTHATDIIIAGWSIPGFTMSAPAAGYSLFAGSAFTDQIPLLAATPGTLAIQTATATSSGGTNIPAFIVTLAP